MITKSEVNHWMSTLGGGDYYELSRRHTLPTDLASDPPRYSACVAKLETVAEQSPKRAATPSAVTLLRKCRELYEGLKLQAVGFLVKSQWLSNLARDMGVSPSDTELRRFYKQSNAERFPSEAAAQQYYASRHASTADEMQVVKLDLLAQGLLRKVKTGGPGALKAVMAAEGRWTAKTSCRQGYVVQRCKQYTGQPAHAPGVPSTSVLMEQVAALATGRCTNLAACAKQ